MDKRLEKIKCFILDMDGTIHLSGTALPGAVEAIERMRKRGRVIFLTNNTSVSRADYLVKLAKMGVVATEQEVYTAGNATIDYLKDYHAGKKIMLVGTPNLCDEFLREGINLVSEKPDLVVFGYDTTLTYEKLKNACCLIQTGTPYILTHPDVTCPSKEGPVPDVGSFDMLIRTATGSTPLQVCGKPNKPIADGVKKMTGCGADEIAMFGDRLATDMSFAKNNNFASVLVLTGVTTREVLEQSGMELDFVFDSIANWDK